MRFAISAHQSKNQVQFQAKVGDFGLARQSEDYCSQNSRFPVKWTAPEAIMTRRFNTKVNGE